jgi:hypothetical protein
MGMKKKQAEKHRQRQKKMKRKRGRGQQRLVATTRFFDYHILALCVCVTADGSYMEGGGCIWSVAVLS